MSLSKRTVVLSLAISATAFSSSVPAAERASANRLTADNFAKVRQLIKPQKNESLWRHIPWETSLNVARRKAAAAGKPLLVWSGGGSAPLGGC